MDGPGVVIVGAGHAGGSAAAYLRQYGHHGPITLIGDEPCLPYQRPPLSKAWLKGEVGEEELQLRPPGFYEDQAIAVRLGATASRIDRAAKTVWLTDGAAIPYDKLILATGARARRLPAPGADLQGVFTLRTTADAEAIKAELAPGRRVMIVGGGYVGLEVAASARTLGAEVTVIEREPRLLARVAGEALSGFFHSYHGARGVRFVLGGAVSAIEGRAGRACAVVLDHGERLPCDVVLVGVGAVPNEALAQQAGLPCEDGVVVDLQSRTEDADIYAIGDLTRRPLPLYGRSFRLESVPAALEQAKQAAADITGHKPPAPEVPWFWSDQYDLKLQLAGLPFDVDRLVVRGEPSTARFAVFHMSGDLIQAVEAVNAPAEFMGGRQLIGARRPVARERLADPAISMKEVAA
ncbi:MAG: FAD-dependent pyridine nucleotide-disulfide oxidoreductase [Caulobacteraceae bacterium]|nr:FAD-dependent pyridine nucleotide-disulfide oxidoreductase [Caulobacteraceae bacterium]